MLKSTARLIRSLLDGERVLSLAVLVEGAPFTGLLHEQDGADKDPLQIKRVSFECDVHPLVRESEPWAAGRERYLARFPDSRITFRLGDFTLYRLEFRQGVLVAGFGRAMDLAPKDIAQLGTLGLP
jgi:hypothetical protein